VFSSNGKLGRIDYGQLKDKCPHSPNDFDSDGQPEMAIRPIQFLTSFIHHKDKQDNKGLCKERDTGRQYKTKCKV